MSRTTRLLPGFFTEEKNEANQKFDCKTYVVEDTDLEEGG
jgi:hypothetical protein